MNISIILLGLLVVLFLAAFVTKRRFGVLGLALAAGAFLSATWTNDLVSVIGRIDATAASMVSAGAVATGLVIAPAVLLLFSGPSYRKLHTRIIGSVYFALFATFLMITPLSTIVDFGPVGRQLLEFFDQYEPYIVTVGIVLALIDLLAIHTIGGGHSKKH